jgi:hypothetical protein
VQFAPPTTADCVRINLHGNVPVLIHGVLRQFDPSLTLTRAQCPAMVGNAGNRKHLTYAGFANPCNTQQALTDHS